MTNQTVLRTLVALASVVVPVSGSAQVRVLFENDTVRVSEATFKIGYTTPVHTHTLPHSTYVKNGGKLRIRRSDGAVRGLDLKTGDVYWGAVETHTAENVGTTEVVLVTTDIKQHAAIADNAHAGHLIAPSSGTPLMFCRSPGLSVNIKVDSASAAVTNLAMGTAGVAAGMSNAGTHDGQDEVVYFLRGDGRAFVGSDTTAIEPGLVTYVPRQTRHGFISTGSTPIEFVWVVVPGDLAKRFRTNGVPPGSVCPAPR